MKMLKNKVFVIHLNGDWVRRSCRIVPAAIIDLRSSLSLSYQEHRAGGSFPTLT